ncbi:MAG: DEAD/DEAH box helicase [Tannerella sp.]|jgi:ATP-dependent RNA helicase DeaD|nr:DEAD/DEAH box helicase [Tannerella sp.]
MNNFEELGIAPELIKAIREMGFVMPMPVQEEVIPLLLNNEGDIIGLAQTGTGKTAAFGLPILQNADVKNKTPQTLILCPTRELCLQISSDLTDYSQYMPEIKILPVYGGSSIEHQIKTLRRGVHIVVATPGRLMDLMRRKAIDLEKVTNVILDEADEMLSMGFEEDIEEILKKIPAERNMLLFSATMPREIEQITKKYMNAPKKIIIGERNSSNENIRHIYFMVHAKDKYLALKRIVDYYPDIYGIIFCRTRNETKEIAENLMGEGYNADTLHGELTQSARDYVMSKFRNRNLQLLVATDVAARGLDVDNLTHVIHYGLPDEPEAYTHRSGRTARAGKTGISIAICHTREKGKLRKISDLSKIKFEHGKVPDSRTICEKQLFNFADKIEKAETNQAEIASIVPSILRKLQWLEKEDIIQRVISLEFNRMIDYYRDAGEVENVEEAQSAKGRKGEGMKARKGEGEKARKGEGMKARKGEGEKGRKHEGAKGGNSSRKLTDNVAEEGMKILKINFGRKDNLLPAKLIEIVNHCVQGKKVEIGRIELHDLFSLFEVERSSAGKVMDSMNKFEIDGRRIQVRNSEKPGRDYPKESKKPDKKWKRKK